MTTLALLQLLGIWTLASVLTAALLGALFTGAKFGESRQRTLGSEHVVAQSSPDSGLPQPKGCPTAAFARSA